MNIGNNLTELRKGRAMTQENLAETASSRPASHDLEYGEGELYYYDTYLGGERFMGEEALWHRGEPVWSMNYLGRFTWFTGREEIYYREKRIYECLFHGGTIR